MLGNFSPDVNQTKLTVMGRFGAMLKTVVENKQFPVLRELAANDVFDLRGDFDKLLNNKHELKKN